MIDNRLSRCKKERNRNDESIKVLYCTYSSSSLYQVVHWIWCYNRDTYGRSIFWFQGGLLLDTTCLGSQDDAPFKLNTTRVSHFYLTLNPCLLVNRFLTRIFKNLARTKVRMLHGAWMKVIWYYWYFTIWSNKLTDLFEKMN